ncbi:hypothetical protein G3580_04315 [Nitrogeniibacter mangrovi]|uniref:DUF1146 domain-containing protein n=1 Tax=Nitrogeniibacter mangrovi TaxID=2016596 RepID=A0A6C1AZY7_9RHOO|nr:hypothetical protein [Nitrogeniibacter mangrovi]QID16931.1 hypothetical protein G3580_04315 [Nitrogeniibacter mangrovi]
MLAFVLSTVAFFAASFYLKRTFEDMGLPRGPTRGLLVFFCALGAAYAVSAAVGWITGAPAPIL